MRCSIRSEMTCSRRSASSWTRPGVAEDLDEEHLEQAVVADELEGDLAAFACELLAAVRRARRALGAEARDLSLTLGDEMRGAVRGRGSGTGAGRRAAGRAPEVILRARVKLLRRRTW